MAIFLAGAGKRREGRIKVTKLSGVNKLARTNPRPRTALCGCILQRFWNGRCCCLGNFLSFPLYRNAWAVCAVLERCPTPKTGKRQGLTGEPVRTIKLFLSSNKDPSLPQKTLKPRKNVCQFLFISHSIAYYSQIVKKDIYLNSGLTSTKNYGKTILTKVGEYSPLQSMNIRCMYVCVDDACHGIVTSFCALSETSYWLSDWGRSLGTRM